MHIARVDEERNVHGFAPSKAQTIFVPPVAVSPLMPGGASVTFKSTFTGILMVMGFSS